MKIISIDSGFALYKEKRRDRALRPHPRPKGGGTFGAFCILPQWRRKGYGSYLLKEALARLRRIRPRKGYHIYRSPAHRPGRGSILGQISDFQPEGTQLVRRRTPDLTAVRFVQDFPRRPAHGPAAVHRRHLRQRRGYGVPVRRSAPPAGGCWASTSSPRPSPPPEPIWRKAGRALRQSFTATATQTFCNIVAARHGGHRDVQLRLAARGRPQRLLHSRQQHPCAGSRPRGLRAGGVLSAILYSGQVIGTDEKQTVLE